MATIRFTGEAPAVAQVDTFTPATVEVGDIFTLTITGGNGRTLAISFTATAGTVANVTAGLSVAWNASTDALAAAITAADDGPGNTITLTADTAGVAFEVASTTTDGGGNDTQTLARAATTANSGPSEWRNVANWSTGALPGGGAGEDVYLGTATILYGLDQSGIGNTLASLHTETARIGINPDSGELPVYLQIKATLVNIGQHIGPGTPTFTPPVNINTGATASTIIVHNAGTNSPATEPSVRLLAASASTNIEVRKGIVGLAYHDGETSTVGNIVVNYVANAAGDADVFIGEGVTLTNLTQKAGKCSLGSAVGTLALVEGGALTTFAAGTITTITVSGGTATLNSTGTITALNIEDRGTVDFTKGSAARTVTTCRIDPGGTLSYDPSIVTMTNKIQPVSTTGNITLRAA